MGRRGPLAALLIALACSAASAPPLIREARWLAPERRLAALTTAPAECFVAPADAAERRRAMIGRAVFGTPLLLGGQAARAGLSCASCHRNGRGNPDFVFPGLSDKPGTADVTASLLSSHRGDGQFNPKPIPDLAVDPPKVARDAQAEFIRGLIVEEFDGLPPPPAVLDGLVSYVRALDGKRCGKAVAVTLATDLSAAREAAQAALTATDPATARLLLSAARSALGRIDERMAGLKPQRVTLAKLDAGLLAIQQALDRRDVRAGQRIAAWLTDLPAAGASLRDGEARSLYQRAVLERALRN